MRPTTDNVDVVVIGAGHAGLAVSRLLTEAGRDHVVLDRGRIGERWRSERWDSLHLVTPNWMSRLPGWWYAGPEPDGFMSTERFVQGLERYAQSFDAPVVTGTTVQEVSADGEGYRVVTDDTVWSARRVVIATGAHGTPYVPPGFDPEAVMTTNQYRNPAQLAPGGVLVVGASSSGVQIADELACAGRDVTIAVGRHARMPRRYRGMDAYWWMEATGRLAFTIDDAPDPVAARHEPSPQLVGRNETDPGGEDLDLATLSARGVRLVGRVQRMSGSTVHLADDLAPKLADADVRMNRFLDTIDRYVDTVGLADEVWAPERPRPFAAPEAPRRLDLDAEGIGTVLLATGFRSHHPWLRLPITEPHGRIRQHRGVTEAPGLYVVGQRYQHRRDSASIDGARHSAVDVVGHLLRGAVPTLSLGQGEEPVS